MVFCLFCGANEKRHKALGVFATVLFVALIYFIVKMQIFSPSFDLGYTLQGFLVRSFGGTVYKKKASADM